MNAGPLPAAGQLFGRASQLAVAVGCFDDLDRSRGAFLLLTGEAGIGKTRLAEEVLALARDRGWRGVWATAWPGDGAPPLWPWVQVLRQIVGSDEVLGGFVPESPTASPAAVFAQSDAVVVAIRRAVAQQPLVVVLDDLQWADTASIRVLAFVASAVRDVGCLLLGTYRTGELARDQVAELARVGRTLAIPQLTDEAAAELLRAAAGDGLSAAATTAVLRRSLGNPLFVWEFGQLMAQSGRLDVAPAAVPDAVAAVIERRLARLRESTIVVLGMAAVAGTRFSVELLARVGDIAVDAAASELAAAAAAGLVADAAPALADVRGASFGFSHDLVRDVVLDGVDPVRRVELHLRAAAVFAERVGEDPSLHAVVADHLDRAGPAHARAAAERWELAAVQARRVLAYHEAAGCFARAAHGWPDDLRRRAALLADAGDCLLLAGELDSARATFRASAQLAGGIPDPQIMSRAVLGMGTGPVAWEVPIASDEQVAMVARALELLPGDSTALRSTLLARLSVAAARPETMQEALHRAQESLRLAEQVGDPTLVAQSLAAVNDALAAPAHTMTRRDNADTIVELALAAGDVVLELLGYRFRIVADLELGDVPAVDRDIAEFSRLAERLRHPLVSWYVHLFHGMRALLSGDLDTADRHQREVADAARATQSANAAMMAATLRFGIDVAAGQPTDPAIIEDLIDADPADWASFAAGSAMARLRAGDHQRARELLMLHAGDGFARLGSDGEQLTTLLLFGRVAVAVDERGAAEQVYTLLSPHELLWAVDGIAGCCWGPVELELGRLALALGRSELARGHLVRARDAAERAGARLMVTEIAELANRWSEGVVESAVPTDSTGNAFRREGQFWTLTYRGRTVRMKDAKGLHDLARLIADLGREIHVYDLAGVSFDAAGAAVRAGGDLGELLDARARAEYRRRLAELDDELADADRCAVVGRAEKAAAERDFITAELAAALGFGGRSRRVADPVERARKAVTARIRLCIGRIEAEHPELARHLTNAVHTGTTCSYRPEIPTAWTL